MSKVKPTDSDRRRMSLRGKRRAIKITANTVEEALASDAKVQYVRDKSRKKKVAKAVSAKRKKKGPSSKFQFEGTPQFEGGFKMSQAGLPTLAKRR